jgi:hypothetical protein
MVHMRCVLCRRRQYLEGQRLLRVVEAEMERRVA